jgi:hypothetical protein
MYQLDCVGLIVADNVWDLGLGIYDCVISRDRVGLNAGGGVEPAIERDKILGFTNVGNIPKRTVGIHI